MVWRYRLTIAYDGSRFSGWQKQPDRRTVQGELARMLGRLGEEGLPTGAGRTDAGVHALGNVAHMDCRREWNAQELRGALRAHAPGDIAILETEQVDAEFHARFGARERSYVYAMARNEDPFLRDRRWVVGTLPDPEWIREALAGFSGPRECASLARSGNENRTTRCSILEAVWDMAGSGALFRITANRFLYGMVRTIVGTLVGGYARGASPGCFEKALEQGARSAAGVAAPPQGLYLAGVRYAGESDEESKLTTRRVAILAGIAAAGGESSGKERV